MQIFYTTGGFILYGIKYISIKYYEYNDFFFFLKIKSMSIREVDNNYIYDS